MAPDDLALQKSTYETWNSHAYYGTIKELQYQEPLILAWGSC